MPRLGSALRRTAAWTDWSGVGSAGQVGNLSDRLRGCAAHCLPCGAQGLRLPAGSAGAASAAASEHVLAASRYSVPAGCVACA